MKQILCSEEYNTPELVDQGEKNRNFSTIGAYFIKRFLNQSGTQTNTSAAHSLGVNPPQEITVTKS